MEDEQEENKFMKQIRDNWMYIKAGAISFNVGIGISTAIIIGITNYDREEPSVKVIYKNNNTQEELSDIQIRKMTVEKDAAIVQRDSLETILVAECSDPETDNWDARVAGYKNCLAQYKDGAAKYKQERDEAVTERDTAIAERDVAVAKNKEYAAQITNYENNPNVKVVYKIDPKTQEDLELARTSLIEVDRKYTACQTELKDAQQKKDAFSNYNVGLQNEGRDRQDAIADLLGPAVYSALQSYPRNIPYFCSMMEKYFIPAKGINTTEQWAKLGSYQKDSPNYFEVYHTQCSSTDSPLGAVEGQ